MAHEIKLSNDGCVPSVSDDRFDEGSFETFFKEYFTQLCAYCQYKFGFEQCMVKDIVQTGFIRLWETRQTLSPEMPLKAYLYKIVTNLSLDMLKHQRVKHRHEKYVLQIASKSSSISDFENVDFKQLTADICKAVAELPEQMRNVFELCRYEGLKYTEVANHLNISVKTVETQMSRALKKLRHQLSDHLTIYCLPVLLDYSINFL